MLTRGLIVRSTGGTTRGTDNDGDRLAHLSKTAPRNADSYRACPIACFTLSAKLNSIALSASYTICVSGSQRRLRKESLLEDEIRCSPHTKSDRKRRPTHGCKPPSDARFYSDGRRNVRPAKTNRRQASGTGIQPNRLLQVPSVTLSRSRLRRGAKKA